MQISKAKKGYKLVDTGFGEFEEIPEEWEIHNFKDFVSLKHGFAFESKDFVVGEGIKIIKIGNIRKDGSVKIENADKISIKIANKNSECSISNEDILIALTGATLGKIGIVKTDEKLLQNQRVGNIFPINDKILDKKFLFFILISNFVQKQIWSFVSSSAQPNIGKLELDKIMFFKPKNISEQQKIVTILSNIDNAIEKINQLIQNTESLKKGLMQKLFTKGIGHTKFKKIVWLFKKNITIPEDYQVFSLDNCVKSSITYGIVQAGPNVDDGIFYVRATDMNGNYLTTKKMLKTSKDIASKYERSKIITGDIIYGIRGTVGKVHLVPDELHGANLTQDTAKISPNTLVNNKFLLWFLRSDIAFNQVKTLLSGSTISGINLNRLQKLKILIPSLEEQKQIATILSNVDSQITKEKLQKSNLELLKKGLMQKLLTGQIRVKV